MYNVYSGGKQVIKTIIGNRLIIACLVSESLYVFVMYFVCYNMCLLNKYV